MDQHRWTGILVVVADHVPDTKCRIHVLGWNSRKVDGEQNILKINRHKFLKFFSEKNNKGSKNNFQISSLTSWTNDATIH